MNKYDAYRDLLVAKLEELYHLSKEESLEAVSKSSVNEMLKMESSANWQMHQPLRSTVAEIYEEYEGKYIPA